MNGTGHPRAPRFGRASTFAVLLGILLGTVAVRPVLAQKKSVWDNMRFATEMTKSGNWREASYRWGLAAEADPDNARIVNNLAVAAEALGDWEAARDRYAEALALAREDKHIRDNRQRFEGFWSRVLAEGDLKPGEPARPTAPERVKAKGPGKPFRATVHLPVPARLDVSGYRTLLVASFLANESAFLNVNREIVRFLRGELRKRAEIDVLGVSPPPAVPEQTLEDLAANREFFRHLGREYDAELIVTGRVQFDRRDSSGFRDVDTISPVTGQKVRQSRFVEQEKFLYEMDLLFMDGATGELLFRDRLQQSAVFQGSQNDPITAFYELSEAIAPDVLAIVKARTRADARFVFKR